MLSTKISEASIAKDRAYLISWYHENKRSLPWRKDRNPYRIWISEVMLQQTTVAAVVPFYERFLTRFPTVQDLAAARIEDVYEVWAGLGYYSRARNLHKAALAIAESGFPEKADQLIELSGFGPYTSRAVASLAFNEHVGVLDGNVIRVLCRRYGFDIPWWENKYKNELQTLSDRMANDIENASVNQALMELGATLCTPKKTLCLMCPWNKSCVAYKQDLVAQIPRPKPRPEFETWLWKFKVQIKNKKVFLLENENTPFLKKNWLPPSTAEKIKTKPKTFHFKHGVTKYDIYVQLETSKSSKQDDTGRWIELSKIKQINPTSLMTKIINHL